LSLGLEERLIPVVDEIDLTSDTPEDDRDGAGLDHGEAARPTHYQFFSKTHPIPRQLLTGVRGKDRQRLDRISVNMARLQWDRVQCRDHMITLLLQEETIWVRSQELSFPNDTE